MYLLFPGLTTDGIIVFYPCAQQSTSDIYMINTYPQLYRATVYTLFCALYLTINSSVMHARVATIVELERQITGASIAFRYGGSQEVKFRQIWGLRNNNDRMITICSK